MSSLFLLNFDSSDTFHEKNSGYSIPSNLNQSLGLFLLVFLLDSLFKYHEQNASICCKLRQITLIYYQKLYW